MCSHEGKVGPLLITIRCKLFFFTYAKVQFPQNPAVPNGLQCNAISQINLEFRTQCWQFVHLMKEEAFKQNGNELSYEMNWVMPFKRSILDFSLWEAFKFCDNQLRNFNNGQLAISRTNPKSSETSSCMTRALFIVILNYSVLSLSISVPRGNVLAWCSLGESIISCYDCNTLLALSKHTSINFNFQAETFNGKPYFCFLFKSFEVEQRNSAIWKLESFKRLSKEYSLLLLGKYVKVKGKRIIQW